jgi:hypothetical protein
MGLFDKLRGGSPEERFWNWFAYNSVDLTTVATCQEPVCGKLSSELQKVCKGLAFAFGPTEGGRREFVVSADGKKELFPAVHSLVAAAPQIPGWKIIAFRPGGSFFSVQVGGVEIGPEDIWFRADDNGSKVDLLLSVKGMTEGDLKTIGGAVFLLLDHAVGEYEVGTRIGKVGFSPLPSDPAATGLKPFTEITGVVKRA